MAIVFTIFLLILGTAGMIIAGALLSVRQAVKQFLDSFPAAIRSMLLDSDPKVKKTLKTVENLPKISVAVGTAGVLLFLFGIFRIGQPIIASILLILAIVGAVVFWKFRDKLTAMLKQQFVDQMQKQAAKMPRPTAAQAKAQFRNMQQTARTKAMEARPPSNRSERRAAERRKS